MKNNNKIIELVKKLVKKKIKSCDDFLNLVKKFAKKNEISVPSIVTIITLYKSLRLRKKIGHNLFLEKMLKKRPVRSLSGVAVISVLTKPYPCPGKCLYCPTDKEFPKSYLPGEPAAERAKFLKFDPYLQVKTRIETLQKNGHSTDKIELIVIGGSWTAYPKKYQEWFITRCFQAANADQRGRYAEQCGKFLRQSASSQHRSALVNAQRRNERAKNRIISLSIETRPDLINPDEIKTMRELGITKIELGIQTLDEKILAKNLRGHGLKEIIKATKLLKDAGFKICYHFMPNLFGSTPSKDLAMFKKMFTDPNFRPDYLKIYPCVVVKNSKLYKLWKKKKYKPYSEKTLIDLLIKMKLAVPPYVRIIRIFRDIPSPKIEAGSKTSNLREIIKKEMEKRGIKCSCIRCREIKNLEYRIKNIELRKREYQASENKEIFLSFEDKKNDKILAFLRLRLPKNYSTIRANRRNSENEIYQYFPVLEKAAIIRELHTYGLSVEIGKKDKLASQHQNLGKKLVKEAENIVKRLQKRECTRHASRRIRPLAEMTRTDSDGRIHFGCACSSRLSDTAIRMLVIAGIGSRKYWKKLGYKLQETYMVKNI